MRGMPRLPPAPTLRSLSRSRSFLAAHEPLGLLTQLTATFQFHPQGEFQGEGSDTARWQRCIEFLTGYLLVRPYPINPRVSNGRRDR